MRSKIHHSKSGKAAKKLSISQPKGKQVVSPTQWDLQSWLLSLLSISVIGIGANAMVNSQINAVQDNKLKNIQSAISGKMTDRYTGSDHRAYVEFDSLRANNMNKQISNNQESIQALEEQINRSGL